MKTRTAQTRTMQTRTTRFTPLFFLLLLMMGALVIASPKVALAQDGPPAEEESANLYQLSDMPDPAFTSGLVLVGLRGDDTSGNVTGSAAPAWGEIEVLAVEPLDVRGGEVSAASGEAPLVGYKLVVPVGTELSAVEALSARSDVVFAEVDWLVHIAQSGLASEPDVATTETPFAITDTLYRDQWYAQRIGMSRAWALALEESEGNLATVEVVVIDTGADFSHPDLAPILASGRSYVSGVQSPQDDNGHGSHVSGLLAAALNGTGIVGPGLDVEITPYKALNADGTGGVTTIGQAIRDAADAGADIINMSLEISIDTFQLRSATQYAVSQGVLIIAASGNHAQPNVAYPAAYPDVLAVGASTYFDARAFYSNRGDDLDIVAPGGSSGHSMLSTWTSDVGAICPAGLSEVNGGFYCETDGTSMASGVVAGVAALVMSLRPELDADEVQEILLDSAFPINGTSAEVGRGRLDAAKAVRLAVEPRLVYDAELALAEAVEGENVFTVTLPFNNPSLVPLSVEMTPTITTTWYALVGPRAGEVSYGDPLEVQLVFTPTAVTSGTFQSSIRLTTTVDGGRTQVYFINTRLHVFPSMVGDERMYVPWATSLPGAFNWLEPSFSGRTNYTIGDDGSIVVDLPFTMTVNDRSYTDLRVYADGFVIGSASAFLDNSPNECLANQTFPSFSVYGWWSDLSLAVNSTLSTFQPDADRFVIEYLRFVSADSSDPDDRVSFQIVLDRFGQIELKYRQTPEHAPTSLTVGASIEDGRFYNQITCHLAGSMRIGEAPQANQSFLFLAGDLY